MKKYLILILFFPLFLCAKTYITVYFPLQESLIQKISPLKDIKVYVISPEFTLKYKELKYSDISKFAKVDVYYNFGLDIEKKYINDLKKINPNLKVIDLSKGIKKDNNIPYIWVDPLNLRIIFKNIYTSLSKFDKKNQDLFKNNYEQVLIDLDEMFLRIKKTIDESYIYNLYVFDDYWYYYAKRFSLNLYKVKKKYIKAEDLSQKLEFVNEKSIHALLVSPDISNTLISSYRRNLNIKVLENNIFNPFYDGVLYELTKQFDNK